MISVDLKWARANQCMPLLELNLIFLFSNSTDPSRTIAIYNARQIQVLGI